MEFLEMTPEQLKEVFMLPTPEEMMAYFEQNDIVLPQKSPWEWPAETEKFTRVIWQKVMFPPRDVCEEGDHDFEFTGKCEMSRNEATMPGSCFSREQRCTKCGTLKWVRDKEPEPEPVAAE
ncbi:MAG: hypothetical protein IJ131_05205 [Eggerthellaceae bacterium]|nr:hypothetical protein [Eggerthellaceae bacterium]